ncbi:MAG: hypothetical protein Ct9H300mP19_07550 [Dehalococcoidia bacterium]|nr:MAG: hypothetical protein Ct9H300mP19_07550 [Dehalococcoidia bacterium]
MKGLAVLHFTDISSAMEATVATLEQALMLLNTWGK